MKILLSIIFIFLINISTLIGQAESIRSSEIEDLFINNKFSAAWSHYQSLLKNDSSNANLNFKMGVCYLNSRSQKEKAIVYFKKALASSDKGIAASIITYKLLADAAYLTFNFDLAIVNYEKYKEILLSTKGDNHFVIEETNQKIELSKMGKELKELKELVASLVNPKFGTAGKNSSSTNLTYSSTSSADNSSLTFTFKRPPTIDKLCSDKNYFEDTAVFYKADVEQLQRNTDTSTTKKETTIATSIDGQIILLYRNENGEGTIYASNLNGNEWTKPEKLNKINNTRGWEPNEFISADGNTSYFTSDREGGLGGKDIYKSDKLPTGEWGKGVNLGFPINTPYDDEAPFINPDGVTLYFSSNRYKKNGSFDIFTSSFSDSSSSWAPVINVGYPENKLGVTVFALQTNLKKMKSLSGKEKLSNEKDNYIVTFINQNKTQITLVKGKIVDKNGNIPKYIKITVANNETGEIAGIYYSDSKTGQYLFILPPKNNNNVTYEANGYLFHSENIDISKETSFYKLFKTIELIPLLPDSKDILNNIFFEDTKATLRSSSNVELNNLFNFLTLNPKVIIELSTCIDKKSTLYDNKLAEGKIQSVINYLVEKGMAKERIVAKLCQRPKKSRKKNKTNGNPEEIQLDKIKIKILDIK